MRQKKLARAIVDNLKSDEPLTKEAILVSVGYSPTTANADPGRMMELDGVKEELEKLGFSEGNAKRVVGSILDNEEEKSSDRLKAAEMVFKVHGTFAGEQPKTQTNIVNIFSESRVQERVVDFERAMMRELGYVDEAASLAEGK